MAPEQQQIGLAVSVKGEVFVHNESGTHPLAAGGPVYEGDEIVTGSGSNVEVRFADDTLMSQGAESRVSLDDYVFEDGGDNSELMFKMAQGTFRMVTGKIAAENPERFKLGSPLATIGIRGTTTVHEIGPNGESHGVEELHSGRAMLVQNINGELRQISSPQELVDVARSGMLSSVRPMTVEEFQKFQSIAPAAMEIERDRQQQQEEQQDDPDDRQQDDGQDVEGEGGEAQGDDVQGETGEGEGAEGMQDPGENVLQPKGLQANPLNDTGTFAAALAAGLQGNIEEQMLEAAGGIFEALENGDLDQAQDMLGSLSELPDDDDIDELISGLLDGFDIPEGGEGQTYTSGTGENFIYGTSGDDVWTGTPAVDFYDGLAGNDQIDGAGNDDVLRGNTGNDTIYGNAGNDIINGGEGNDFIEGGEGNDTIYGDAGNDIIYGLAGADLIHGGAGNDTIYGGDGNDVISGGSDNDILWGGAGDDTITGDDGSDTINGGAGHNILDGGEGYDFVSYSDATDSVNVNLSTHQATGTDISDTLVNFEGIIGGSGADSLTGDSGDNTFIPGMGADYIVGNGGNDTVNFMNSVLDVNHGGSSADGIEVELSEDWATYTGDGTDYSLNGISNIIGSAHDDNIRGDSYDNYLFGGAGNDFLEGNDGDDTLVGGSGNNNIEGGSGYDTLDYSWINGTNPDGDTSGISMNANLLVSSTSYTINQSGGNDLVKEIEHIIGTEYDDNIQWANGSINVDGGAGNDTIYSSNSFSVTVTGGEGNDYLYTNGGSDALYGGAGNDSIYSGDGADTIYGGDGDDSINLYTDDTSGTTIDTIYGGSGSDTYLSDNVTLFNSSTCNVIQDFSNCCGDNDSFSFNVSNGFSSSFEYAAIDNYSGTMTGSESGAYFVWDSANDILYYDSDVQTAGDVKIAEVHGDDVTSADISVV